MHADLCARLAALCAVRCDGVAFARASDLDGPPSLIGRQLSDLSRNPSAPVEVVQCSGDGSAWQVCIREHPLPPPLEGAKKPVLRAPVAPQRPPWARFGAPNPITRQGQALLLLALGWPSGAVRATCGRWPTKEAYRFAAATYSLWRWRKNRMRKRTAALAALPAGVSTVQVAAALGVSQRMATYILHAAGWRLRIVPGASGRGRSGRWEPPEEGRP